VTDLGTLEGFAERRGVTVDLTDKKALTALEDASAFIRGYTGQVITQVTDDTVALDGTGLATIILPQTPVAGVSEAKTLDWEDTEYEVTSLRVSRFGILRRMDGYAWPVGMANVVITYDHGWETVPPDIAAVCYDLAAENYVATGGGAVTSLTLGNSSVTYDAATVGSAELPETIRYVLDCYRVTQ